MKIMVLQLIKSDVDSADAQNLRDKWEEYWIARLYSLVPKGMNIQK